MRQGAWIRMMKETLSWIEGWVPEVLEEEERGKKHQLDKKKVSNKIKEGFRK